MVQLHNGVLCNILCIVFCILIWKALQVKLSEKSEARKSVLCHYLGQKKVEGVYTCLFVNTLNISGKKHKKLLALVARGEGNPVLGDRSARETSSVSFHAFEFEQCESISYAKN